MWTRAWGGICRRANRAWAWLARTTPRALVCQRALDWLLAGDSQWTAMQAVLNDTSAGNYVRLAASRASLTAALAALEYGQASTAARWTGLFADAPQLADLGVITPGLARLIEQVGAAAQSDQFVPRRGLPIGWLDERTAQIGSWLDDMDLAFPLEDPAAGDGSVSTFCLARAAASVFCRGERDLLEFADGIVSGLASRQSAEGWLPERMVLADVSARGGLHLRPASRTSCDPRIASADRVAAAGALLLAASWQVRAALADSDADLRLQIHHADGRLHALRAWAADVFTRADGAAVGRAADLGCGTGRYLRYLQPQLPNVEWTGIDASGAALLALPPGVAPRQGDLRRLPAADGEFDAAFCIEALEHSLAPQAAIAEICRVVRPGGNVMIIDKNASHQPLSECRPWERWFEPLEIVRWLSESCRDVKAAPIPHGARMRPSGLFYCWTGRRRPQE